MAFHQDNESNRQVKNPMNLTINTLAAAGTNNKINSNNNRQNRFPFSSPITDEIPSPEHSSGSENSSKPKPKLVNTGLAGVAGEGLNLHADSALSKTEFERALKARLLEQENNNSRLEMATITSHQQQRLAGLQLMTDFADDVESEKGTFLDLSDLKSIANAREKERLREYNSSLQSLPQPVPARTSELSPSDRPIMIGLTVPYDESTFRGAPAATRRGDTIDSASSRTPVTPSIVVTPARENPPWHMDMQMDMSTSPEMLHRPRAASSIYSQPSPKPMYDEDAPPVPAIPAFHSVTSFHHDRHNRRDSTGTEFEGDDIPTTAKESSPTTTRKNMKKKLLHKLSVNTSDANRPDSQGWWTYLLSPLLSRSNTVNSRRTALSPQQHQQRSARSPLSAVSFSRALSPPQPTTATEEGESSTHWWDDEKQVIPPEKSHFSPDTPEDMTRHAPPIPWDMPFSDNHITTTTTRAVGDDKGEKTRSVFQIGDQVVPNYEFHGARAEYYQASAHDQYDKENPYFECINHVCSMTSAKRRAEIEAAEREAEERMRAEEADNEKRGLAVFVFDPSRDPQNPFIAFLDKGVVQKAIAGDGEEQTEKVGEEDAKTREVAGEEVGKTGLSNARDLLSFDSSEDDESVIGADEKGAASRRMHQSPELAPAAKSVASFSPPPRSRYEPSVSLPPPVEESRGFAPPPPAPVSVSYSREISPPPAPASAPAPAPLPVAAPPAPAPAPVQMPMMPPPQPLAFSLEPVAMPMPFPAPVPAPAPPPPREPVPMPMPVSRSPPMNQRGPVAMPSPPQPAPSNDASICRGIPSDYQWESAPVARAMSSPRPTRLASPPMPPAAAPMSQSREIEESAVRSALEAGQAAEQASISRPPPSFSRPGPFSAPRRVPQPPAPPQQSTSNETAADSDSESELPPYSRNAPHQPGLPTYSARDQSEQRDRAPIAPAPISPGLQQVMTSRGGIPMSDVSQRSIRDVDFNDAGSVSRTGEPRTIINVHHYYSGEHSRDVSEPPRPAGNQFVSEADLQSRNENEARRQRLEKEDKLAKKVGGFWRGRGCIPDKGCFGRGGREGRVRRRWYAVIIVFCILVIVLSISLAITLTHKGDVMSVESEWLNITGFPPIPTGIMTIAGPAPAVERSSCIAPTQAWSCALPPEQQAGNAGGYSADVPNFRIEIRFRNASAVLSNTTASNSTTRRSWGDIFRRDNWDASPAAPRLVDQIFLGNTTDNITTPFQGEDTPFYITFLSPVDVSNATAAHVKRDVSSTGTGTTTATATGTGTVAPTGTATTAIPTHVSATGTGTQPATGTATSNTGTKTNTKTATGTQTQTGTSTATSTSSPGIDVGNLIPAPDLASDGTAAAATLYPLPVQQPIKLYNRGLPTEHYGFFTYFDKSIFLASDGTITGSATDSDSRDVNGGSTETAASVRCTWSQTRFLVQIWTQPQNVTHMSVSAISNMTTAASSTASAATSTATSKSSSGSLAASSANNFTSPGSFPYPITVTIDRHGGLATQKLAYCYGLEQHNSSSSSSSSTVIGTYYNLTNPKLQAEQRNSDGSIIQPSPDYLVLAAAIAQGVTAGEENPVDGGTGGCMCQWRNWIETH
ncbi:hypothetical protein TMatcc_002386 [Talaromyces marneffei ATCC 18224]|uniref:Uncharacterized protein n=1 Tax=Talaromyces marneffei (strain ATCC 18224 / CBS 334.59 / QM 7333) TaxID=441960 RepID=B6QJV3_TALMQ|nr:conserved hypothetical protein [Talaromyces marneffei ATCC 18224]